MGADASNCGRHASYPLEESLFSSCAGSQSLFFGDNMDYKIILTSTSNIFEIYIIEIDTDLKTVTCNCKSGRIRGYCKHIKFYKALIKQLLRENPGFEEEKGGK